MSIQPDGAQSPLNPGVSELRIKPRKLGPVCHELSAETSDLGGTPGRRSALILFLKEGVESSVSEDSEGGARRSEHQIFGPSGSWLNGHCFPGEE